MTLPQTNAVSIPREEFEETFLTIQELVDQNVDPNELVIEDPFLSTATVKIDLGKHLRSLYGRMCEIKASLKPATRVVTIDFN